VKIKLSIVVIAALCNTVLLSQTAAYKESLKKNIMLFESSKSTAELAKAATGFENMLLTEKKEWLTYYYAGLCNVLVAFEKPKKEIDTWCDKAEKFALKADSLNKNNSEVQVLRSMIAAARINVNQLQRGQKYGAMAARYANEAVKLNEANPRAHFVKAQAILYTPSAFGGGEKKAKAVFESVLEKFKTFKPESDLFPKWGKAEAEKELKKINTKQKK
jgi:hypothetical protein